MTWSTDSLRPCRCDPKWFEEVYFVQRTGCLRSDIPGKRCRRCGHEWFTGPGTKWRKEKEDAV